jgi:hypothetical protein
VEAAVGSTPTNGRALCNVSFRHGSGREVAPGQRYNHASYTKVGARTFCDRKDSTISTRSLPFCGSVAIVRRITWKVSFGNSRSLLGTKRIVAVLAQQKHEAAFACR